LGLSQGAAPTAWLAVGRPVGDSRHERFLRRDAHQGGFLLEPMRDEFVHIQQSFTDQMQWRYELIRPTLLFNNPTPAQRAEETQTHIETVREVLRQFRRQGMLGLAPHDIEITPKPKATRVSQTVVDEIARLKQLYSGFQYRELARIIFYTLEERVHHQTIKRLWQLSPEPAQGELALGSYHRHADRYQTRLEVIKLYAQGWSKLSISRYLHISRTTVYEWIRRFEEQEFAGLQERSRAPKSTPRKAWLPLMIEVYHLQKRHPDAGEFRIWSLLGHTAISDRTIGRVMAINRQVYDDIPHHRAKRAKHKPQPHPFKASYAHEYWFIDGRKMDFELDGVRWWSLIVLDGYSRTMLAGAVAPSEASWVALTVLYTACLRYGTPEHLISDKGGAFTSNEVEAVCQRLGIDHQTITSTQGESYMNLMESHFNIQRRLYDYQFSLTQTPLEFEQVHRDFIQLYNTTAHQGLLKEKFKPPIPLEVLGEAKGRLYTPDELERKFSRALFPRTTNRYGCVTLHSYHFYVEEGLPKTQVLLWV
jgi:transposase